MDDLFNFAQKVALITGGSRGLGRSMALAFAARGAAVIVASRKLEQCEETAAEIVSVGGQSLPLACHVGQWGDLEPFVERAYAWKGRVDILVNNAGMSPIADSSLSTSEDLFDKVMAVNCNGPFRLSALVGTRMVAGDGGSIINVSSIGSLRSAPKHLQQTQILVEPDTPGIKIVRPLNVFGYLDQPNGHAEIIFDNVRVPAENVILGEGRGFEIAQGRLGPGRIHHCMRLIGVAELTLEKICRRLISRSPFGKPLADRSLWQQRVAEMRTDLELCRLMVYKAAWLMDTVGVKNARSEIAQIKVLVPRTIQNIIDTAIQAHGTGGVGDDFGLGFAYARARVMRLGDGPDEVHNVTIARQELAKYRPSRREQDAAV